MPFRRTLAALVVTLTATCARRSATRAPEPTRHDGAVQAHAVVPAPSNDAHTDAAPVAPVAPVAAVAPVAPVAPTTAASSSVDDTPPVRATCLAQTERARARVAAAFHDDHGEVWIHPTDFAAFMRCFPSPHGAWVAVLDTLHWSAAADDPTAFTLRGRYEIGYITPLGTVVRMSSAAQTLEGGQWEGDSLAAIGTSDLDGDGIAEFFFQPTRAAHEASEEDTFRPIEVATFHGGVVTPYAPLGAIRARTAEDYDSDGRLDLRVASEFVVHSDACGGLNPAVYRGPTLLYHARPDGTFSNADSVASIALRSECPTLPTQLLAPVTRETLRQESEDHGMDTAETVRRIACARYWGQTPGDLARQLRAEFPSDASPCVSLDGLVQLARTPTASTLRLR